MVVHIINKIKKAFTKADQTGPVTNDTQDLNGMLDDLLVQGQRRQSQFMQMYEDAVRYVYGDQIKEKDKKVGWEYPVMNRMFADVQQEIAMLSIGEPRVETIPVEDTDQKDAEVLGMVLQHEWTSVERQMMSVKIIQGELDSALSGFRVCKWYWNPKDLWDEENSIWRGRMETVIVNPRYFGCDEDVELAFDLPRKARFIWTKRWVDKRWAAFRWPKYATFLEEKEGKDYRGGIPISRSRASTDETRFNRGSNAWSGRELSSPNADSKQARLADVIWGGSNQNNGSLGQNDNLNMTCIQEFHVRDYETEPLPKIMEQIPVGEPGTEDLLVDDSSGVVLYFDKNKPISDAKGNPTGRYESMERPMRDANKGKTRPKYPSGRQIIRLDDGNNKFIAHDAAFGVEKTGNSRRIIYRKPPYAIAPNMILPHIWQGSNLVELSTGFQDYMNSFASHFLNWSKFFGDPILNIQDNNWSKHNKGVIANSPGQIRWFKDIKGYKVDQPPSLPQGAFELYELFKEQDQDLKGIHDVAQGKAGSGSQTLGEIDKLNRNTRLRVAVKGIIQNIWIKQIAHGMVELLQAHMTTTDWGRLVGPEQDKVISSQRWTQGLADAKVDIRFEAATTLPFDEEREVAKYVKAFEITGPSMLEDVLRKMKIPNVDKILKKHELLGILGKLIETAAEANVPPDQLMAVLQQQISAIADQEPGAPGPQSPPPQGQPQATPGGGGVF